MKKVSILGLVLATTVAVTHNAPKKVTDHKETTSEASQRPTVRFTPRQQVGTRTRACLLALGSGSLAGAFAPS